MTFSFFTPSGYLFRLLFVFFYFTFFLSSFKAQGVNFKQICPPDSTGNLIVFEHFEAHINIDPLEKIVNGKIVFTFNKDNSEIDSIVLNSNKFIISELKIDSEKADWYSNDTNLVVRLREKETTFKKHHLEIYFKVKLDNALFFTGWNDANNIINKQIWAQSPCDWLPCINTNLTSDLYVTFDSAFKIFSNGVRESVDKNPDGTSTWHYKMGNSVSFLSTTLAIGNYNWKNYTSKSGLPVELWYNPNQEGNLESSFRLIDEMISFCVDEIKLPYPLEIFRQVPVDDNSFVESDLTTSNIFGNFIYPDERSLFDRKHESQIIFQFFHHWIGSYFLGSNKTDPEVIKSFATFYARIFERKYFGEDHYEWVRLRSFDNIFKTIAREKNELLSDDSASQNRIYRNSLVLEMLMDELDVEGFRESVMHYFEGVSENNGSFSGFQKAVYDATGNNMNWFFEQWFNGFGMPHYRISIENYSDHLFMKTEQIQDTVLSQQYFKTKHIFETFYIDGSTEQFLFENDSKEQIAVIPKKTTMLFLLFDPGNRLLKQTTYKRSVYDRFDQFLNTKLIVDRYHALVELREISVEDKRSIYLDEVRKIKSYLIKEEILMQLSEDTHEDAIAFFSDCLNDDDPLIRKAALNYFGQNHLSILPQAASALDDISYGNTILALHKLYELDPENIEIYLSSTSHLKGFSGKDVRIEWLGIAVNSGHNAYFDELVDYSSNKYDLQTRLNAIEVLTKTDLMNPLAVLYLLEAAQHRNSKLNKMALSTLQKFAKNETYYVMIQSVINNEIKNEPERERLMQKVFSRSTF